MGTDKTDKEKIYLLMRFYLQMVSEATLDPCVRWWIREELYSLCQTNKESID